MVVPIDVQLLIERFINFPGYTIDELDAGQSLPTLATIRDVDIISEEGGSEILVKYSSANWEVDLADSGGLSAVLARLASSTTPYSMPNPGGVGNEFKSPMSLQNKAYTYVILRLTNKNWQFSHNFAPFSLDIRGKNSGCYFNARKVDRNGRVVEPSTRVVSNCRIAYFIANGEKALESASEYEHGFNLHLDLRYRDSDGNDSFIPVIIDPDVRYPGGSGVDGGGP